MSSSNSTSPTRISLGRSTHHSHFHRSPLPNRFCFSSRSTTISLGRSVSTSNHRQHDQKSNIRPLSSAPKKTCACSPTTHPGSYRCSLHRNNPAPGHVNNQTASSNHRLNLRRFAMMNSLVRIGTVEGDLVKRALASLIRPSSLTQEPRADFQPRPSRLSIMSKAEE